MKKIVAGVLAASLLVTGIAGASASTKEPVIDEKWGQPVYVYGGSLTEIEISNLAENFGYKLEDLESYAVTGQDMVQFLGDGNPNANMYSSAIITRTNKGTGIEVVINNKQNITKITEDQYTNAMITAGVEDAKVQVDSPKPVTGESALTGIYKAYAEKGEELDQDRMEVAQLELETTSNIAENLDETAKMALDDALVEIKQQLAEIKEGQLTEEKVEEIVNKALEARKLDIVINAEQVTKLVELGFKYGQTDAINSEAVKEQLGNLSDAVGEKLGNLKDWADETGFWAKIGEFFTNVWGAITGLFTDLTESTE